MEAEQALVILNAYGEHQAARKRMKTAAIAAGRNDVDDKAEVIGVVQEYLRTGERLENAIVSQGIVGV